MYLAQWLHARVAAMFSRFELRHKYSHPSFLWPPVLPRIYRLNHNIREQNYIEITPGTAGHPKEAQKVPSLDIPNSAGPG